MVVAGLFILTACGSGTNATEGYTTDPSTDPATITFVEAPGTEDTCPITSVTLPPEGVASGFTLPKNDAIIYLNQNMADALAILGSPIGVHETPSCAFDGIDRIFGFPGLQIHTYPIREQDFIQIIRFTDDSIRTSEGIFLGSSWSNVLAAYGNDYVQDFDWFTFRRGYTSLTFVVRDGTVMEILYELIMS